MRIAFSVNGRAVEVEAEPLDRLLDVLREGLGLTGTKEGCGEGECGACTVLVDGRAVNACLVPAIQVQGASVVTVEGLGLEGRPVQRALVERGGVQCGFCTPGIAVAALDLLRREPQPDEAVVREGLAGNLCRCTGYQAVVDAVVSVGAEEPPTEEVAR